MLRRKNERLSKSRRLGLSQPYDWSNPDIDDDVLIRKVLRQCAFDDVARICVHYGWERVARQAKELGADFHIAAILDRQLKNIRTAMLEEGVYAPNPAT